MYINDGLNIDEGFEENPYEILRKSLAPKYQNLPPEDIEQILQDSFLRNVSPEDAEDFFRDLGRFVSSPVVGQVASVALPIAGTVVGTAVGGPVGGALGGAIGSSAGKAIGSATASRQSPTTTQSPTATPLQKPKQQVLQPPRRQTSGASGAASQLIGLIFQPQVLQALLAMTMGSAGRQNIAVGGKEVPVAAFANLLGTLANQVAVEYNGASIYNGEDIPRYLTDSEGEFLVDPAVPEQRAAALLKLLQESYQEQLVEKVSQRKSNHTSRQQTLLMEIDEMYDALDLAELYAGYETWEED
ncbi:hypothetical protein IQ276_007315 [Desmonostoc muscorum LEGE 12446]|uniref:Uncharacterized protein n=1 Tax=Desmonostoc muscorum LEGE 12446 TaxID=1828758 RepID=A0A8J7CZ73_DESMC|nr:hypothetical protein [Desmonostoc muscorum]MCF2146263.1 hypothetical protein [Desmonostoc muscorum LEGE 12446]